VIVLSAGVNGCYGGLGIVARGCDWVVMTEEGRLSVSGPEVIEAQEGVEEFDARDRALVWRTMGGKHRYLLGEADVFCEDDYASLRAAVKDLLHRPRPLDLASVLAEHAALRRRIERFGAAGDALDIWSALGVQDARAVPMMETPPFVTLASGLRERADA
jgi:malonate decarboxylase beta subunit